MSPQCVCGGQIDVSEIQCFSLRSKASRLPWSGAGMDARVRLAEHICDPQVLARGFAFRHVALLRRSF